MDILKDKSWVEIVAKIAPTVALALGGPMSAMAVSAVSKAIGIGESSQQSDLKDAIENGMLSPESISELRKLEMQYQNEEKERGFRYADLQFQDVANARKSMVEGGISKHLFWFSVAIVCITMLIQAAVLFMGIPGGISETIANRSLGFLESLSMIIIGYWYGSSMGSKQKTDLLQAQKD